MRAQPITEAEWNTSTDPQAMLDFLRTSGQASDRKLRLFAVACCRRVWPLLTDERGRRAVEVAEGYADGLVSHEELQTAHDEAGRAAEAAHWANHPGPSQTAAEAATAVAGADVCPKSLRYVVEAVQEAVGDEARDDAWEETYQDPGKSDRERWAADEALYREAATREQTMHAALLRDIFDPFRKLSPLDVSCSVPAVLSLAQRAYDDRTLPSGELSLAHLVALAAALDAAGCTDAALLSHLRGPGPHVRACFALDLVLGRR